MRGSRSCGGGDAAGRCGGSNGRTAGKKNPQRSVRNHFRTTSAYQTPRRWSPPSQHNTSRSQGESAIERAWRAPSGPPEAGVAPACRTGPRARPQRGPYAQIGAPNPISAPSSRQQAMTPQELDQMLKQVREGPGNGAGGRAGSRRGAIWWSSCGGRRSSGCARGPRCCGGPPFDLLPPFASSSGLAQGPARPVPRARPVAGGRQGAAVGAPQGEHDGHGGLVSLRSRARWERPLHAAPRGETTAGLASSVPHGRHALHQPPACAPPQKHPPPPRSNPRPRPPHHRCQAEPAFPDLRPGLVGSELCLRDRMSSV